VVDIEEGEHSFQEAFAEATEAVVARHMREVVEHTILTIGPRRLAWQGWISLIRRRMKVSDSIFW
jgi:hypothetical protein